MLTSVHQWWFMKKSLKICGYENSTFKFADYTLFLTKYDDGRFEYYGHVGAVASTEAITIPHPVNVVGVPIVQLTNMYSNTRMLIVTGTCGSVNTRVDVVTLSDGPSSKSWAVNIYVRGFWK